LEQTSSALRCGDAAGARPLLLELVADHPDDPEVLEALGRAAYLELDFQGAIDDWQRAYAGFRAANDQFGAVRVARALAPAYGMVLGDGAVMSGWMARAQTLLGESLDSPEAGWVALNIGMFEGERFRKDERFRTALAIARRHRDVDLEIVSLAYLGASLVHGDRIDEGMRLLDEAPAAVAGTEVESFQVLEEVFCQLFSACEHAHDVARADQWIRVGERIAAERRLPSVAAFCQTHYGGGDTIRRRAHARPGSDRGRRRRPQFSGREGGWRRGIRREADAAVELLHLLERTSPRRHGDRDPTPPRLGRVPHQR
jgi:hypothetical protein